MCQPLCKLLGSELSYFDSDAKLQTSEVVRDANSTIGLLFASDGSSTKADACREMKELIESVVELHAELRKRNGKDDSSFEVVLISLKEITSSEDPASKNFSSIKQSISQKDSPLLYISSQSASIIQEYLARKYEIQETPSLVLLNAFTTEVILYNAKDRVLADPKGTNFPWRYPTLRELCSLATLLRNTNVVSNSNYDKLEGNQDGLNLKQGICQVETEQVSADSINSPVRALLFAAFWVRKWLPRNIKLLNSPKKCPPCRTFLTALMELYHKLNKSENRLEIIFVSSDRSQESFNRFFSLMPWIAIPYENEKLRQVLTKMYNVKAIPNLKLVDGNDKVISTDGRLEVNDDLEGIEFPWYKRLVDELRDRHSTILNNNLCMIYFTDDTETDYEKGELVLTPIAVEIENSLVPEACETKCFVGADSDLAESLRIFMDLDETRTYLVVMDISNFRYAVQELKDGNKRSVESAKEFLQQFQKNKLVYKYIQSRFV